MYFKYNLVKFSSDVDALMAQLKNLELELHDAKQSNNSNQQQLTQLKQEMEMKDGTISQLQSYIDDLNARNQELDLNSQINLEEFTELQKQNNELRLGLQTEIAANQEGFLNSFRTESQMEINELNDRVEELMIENQILLEGQEKSQPENLNQIEETDSGILLETLRNLTEQNSSLKNQLEELNSSHVESQVIIIRSLESKIIENEEILAESLSRAAIELALLQTKHDQEILRLQSLIPTRLQIPEDEETLEILKLDNEEAEERIALLESIITNNTEKFQKIVEANDVEVNALEETIEILELELHTSNQVKMEVGEKDQMIINLKADLVNLNTQFESEKNIHLDEIAKLRIECDELRYQNAELCDSEARLEQTVKSQELVHEQNLQSNIQRIDSDHQNELIQFNEKITLQSNQLHLLESKLLETERINIRKVDDYKSENETCDLQLQEANQNLLILTQDGEEAEERIALLESIITNNTEKFQAIVDASKLEVESLMDQIEDLEFKLQNLNQSTKENDYQQLKHEIKAKDLTLVYLQSNISELTMRNSQLDLDTRSHLDELSELRKNCEDLGYQNTNLGEWNAQMEENIKYYETLPSHIEQLQLQLNQSEADHQIQLSQLNHVIEDKSSELDASLSRYTEIEST